MLPFSLSLIHLPHSNETCVQEPQRSHVREQGVQHHWIPTAIWMAEDARQCIHSGVKERGLQYKDESVRGGKKENKGEQGGKNHLTIQPSVHQTREMEGRRNNNNKNKINE